MLVKNSNFLFFLVFCLFLSNLSQAIEPDVFVQSTVNRASSVLSNDISIEKKISENLVNFKEIELEYFVIADEKNLKPIKHKQAEKCRAFIAAYISGVRLIDNVKLY